ncbi:hypothetical protein [Pontibacter sp. BAB1700]|uniref:hypothetical protein n=1 Tax=Pontibacter sp. BAB1700 TaxID=1144253 RepID=UPI00026BD272|nr:hypothetical protein [Pontibacter sp. BAB1700]EJF08541.1 hypothetical protein O71_20232 [Pontibacter sp. BAB1700]
MDKIEVKRLNKLAKIIKGLPVSEAELLEVGEYPYLTPHNIEESGIILDESKKYMSFDSLRAGNTPASAGDILVWITQGGIKWYQLRDDDPKAFPGQGVVLIRSKSPDYISTYFSSEQGKQALKDIEAKWNISKQFSSYLFDKLNKLIVPIIHTNRLLDLSDESISNADEQTLRTISNELLEIQALFESVDNERKAYRSALGNVSPVIFHCYHLESRQLDLFSDDTTDDINELRKSSSKLAPGPITKSNRSSDQYKQLPDEPDVVSDYLLVKDKAILIDQGEVTEPVYDEVQTLKNVINELDQSTFVLLREFLEGRFRKIEVQLNEVSGKLNDVLSILLGLQHEINQIKALPRGEEERLSRIYIKLDEKVESLFKRDHKSHEMYIEEIKRWFNFWEDLDSSSKSFLPSAEFLYDEIFKMKEAADFSPFVIQYCRTLENEILKKLFVAFHEELLINGVDRRELVQSSLIISRYKSFAESVLNDNREYTLGAMRYIMSQLREEYESYQQSLLLQSLKAFIRRYFEENVLEQSFLNSINTITYEFRNKAAHPHILDLQVAKECQVILRKCLIHFMSSRKIGVQVLPV